MNVQAASLERSPSLPLLDGSHSADREGPYAGGVNALRTWRIRRIRPIRHRAVLPLVGVLAAVALFIGYLRMAYVSGTNADGASVTLQSWQLLHGNVLLH